MFKEDHMQGQGLLRVCEMSLVYRGNFEHGKLHGPGVIVTEDGRVIAGRWEHGNIHSL